MSEFIAEAQVLVRPDTKAFRTQLVAQLAAATKGIVVPIAVTPVASKGVTALAGATSGLAASNQALTKTSLEVAGSQAAVAAATTKSTASMLGAGTAASRLDAALLGLRTAIGSSAVIGLGALALAAIVAGKAISASIKNFAAFQQELSTFRVVAGASADQMRAVSEEAARLGDDVRLPAVSASDAAIAMTELAKAGLTVEEAMAGARGVLELATAAQISNAEAALITANALNSFGLAGDQATRVADDLANAANAAQGSISDFGLAFRQSSAVARQVGLSLEDTTAILGLFAKNGLQGSDAGTSLRVALIRLVAPTKAAAAEIKALGLNIRDASGDVRADVFAQFGEATKNLTPAARDAAAALIFGQDAIRAVAIGAREGTDGLRLMQFQIDQTGTAAEVSGARTEGLAGSFSALSSTAQTVSIEFGKIISLGLKPYVDAATLAISVTSKLVNALDDFVNAALNVDTPLGKIKDRLFDIASVGTPIIGEVRLIKFGLSQLGVGVDENAEKISTLTKELRGLQSARISAEKGGESGLADQLTKQIKALRAEIDALKREGQGLTGGVTDPLKAAVAELEKVKDIRISLGVDHSAIDRLIAKLKAAAFAAAAATIKIDDLPDGITKVGLASQGAAVGVDALTAAMRRLRGESSTLSDQLQKAQAEGASPQAQIGLLQQQNTTQREIIANAEKGGRQAGDISTIRKARAAIIANNAEIASLQGQIASDVKSAAGDAKKRSDDIAKDQEELTRAFLDGFSSKHQKALNAVTNAGLTERLSDDIKFNTQLRAFLRSEIDQIKDRIKKLGLHGAALKAARDAIKSLNQEIFNITNEIAQDQKTQQENIQNALNQRLDLRIQLAQARDNVAGEIKARRAKLAQTTKELVKLKNDGKKNTLAWLELKVQQAEEIAAIKELEKKAGEKNKETGNVFKQLSFQVLQQQQGFAANLLGNLIPSGATGGLVGGVSSPGRTAAGVEKESAVAAGRDRGFSAGQGSTTNSLLREIRNLLKSLNSATGHPEAHHQKKVSSGGGTYGAEAQ